MKMVLLPIILLGLAGFVIMDAEASGGSITKLGTIATIAAAIITAILWSSELNKKASNKNNDKDN